jgi:NTE family protein
VGGGMDPKDKLDDFVAVLMQTSMFPSNLKNPENRKNCTILVDHLPNLRFSTADFDKSNEIYEDGKIATKLNIGALTALAEKLKGFKQRKHYLPKVQTEFVFDTIVYNNISKENIPLVIARTNIKPHTQYNTKDLIKGINRAMGTNLFSQITYSYFITEENKLGLTLNGFEYSKNQVNASLHYDTYRGVGMILNYTGRNILSKSSRLVITADIAEQPKGRIDFHQNFGKKKEWWWGSELYGAFMRQELFIDGKSADNMLYNSVDFKNYFNRNINSLRSFVGFVLNYNYTEVRPKNDPYLNPNVLSLNNYNFETTEAKVHFSFNDMDKVFFATDGTIIRANINRSVYSHVNVSYTDEALTDHSDQTNGFTKFGFGIEQRLQPQRKITYIMGFDANFIFEDKLKEDDLSFSNYGYAAKYFLGGIIPTSGNNRFSFPGLNEDELNVSQFMAVKLGAQISLMNKIYLTPHFNIATVGFGNFNDYIGEAFNPKGNWDRGLETSLLLSAGGALSYQSILGPIHFDTSWVNNIDKVRVFFSVGFSFNPSN